MPSQLDPVTAPAPAPAVVVPRNVKQIILSAIVIILALVILLSIFGNERFGWQVIGAYLFSTIILTGIANTLLLTFLCMIAGTLLGAVIALMKLSSSPPLQWIATVYTWIFRGVPLLVLLLFFFNLAALFPQLELGIPGSAPLITLNANEIISPFMAAFLALSLHESAYMAEIIRSGIAAVAKGQSEAAHALGMKPLKVIQRIIFPQAMRLIVPPTANQVITMLKSTSLVSVLALSDLLYSAQIVYSQNYQVIPLLAVATIWYLILVSILTWIQSRVERVFNRGYGEKGKRRKKISPSPSNTSKNPSAIAEEDAHV
ncbi:amino acid ABC transporter permease [Glutamicibacter ardleyensis]|uniref:amino acid ABC transporter permease n=1 Tax=Glutamicibacter ardleyensis TaxID=225894 RepID=UPI003FD23A69